jgi:WD40 repeat protein
MMVAAVLALVGLSGCAPESFTRVRASRRIIPAHDSVVRCLAVSPDGQRFASAAGRELKVWDAFGEERVLSGELSGRPVHLSFSPDGRSLALAEDGIGISVTDLATGAVRVRFPAFEGTVSALAFESDSRILVSASVVEQAEMPLSHWSISTRIVFRRQDAATGAIREARESVGTGQVALSPYGRWLAHGTADHSGLVLWDSWTGIERIVPEVRVDPFGPLVFSPDGTKLGCAHQGKGYPMVWVVDVRSARVELASRRPNRSAWQYAHGMGFSRSGTWLIRAVPGGLQLWSMPERRPVETTEDSRGLLDLPEFVHFLADDRTVVVPGGDGSLELWDIESLGGGESTPPSRDPSSEME